MAVAFIRVFKSGDRDLRNQAISGQMLQEISERICSKCTKKEKKMKVLAALKEVPFGPPPEQYNYRCSVCKTEILVNEAVIDTEIGMARFNNKYYKGYMPQLGCPGCGNITMICVE